MPRQTDRRPGSRGSAAPRPEEPCAVRERPRTWLGGGAGPVRCRWGGDAGGSPMKLFVRAAIVPRGEAVEQVPG